MELIVEKDYTRQATRFWLKEKRGDQVDIIGQINGQLTATRLNGFELVAAAINPLLEMPMPFAADFLAAVAKYLDQEGIHPESQKLLEGKLMASERHLNDLRKHFDLLFTQTLLNHDS
ncbi:MAG: hypothetical protein JW857_10405 [Bacteroidales bacterium]|nr:hypothetical protein [Bacteroidales bacterium]